MYYHLCKKYYESEGKRERERERERGAKAYQMAVETDE
jgi:hypothetical protein